MSPQSRTESRTMHYIRLICIFSYLCLWHFGDATPFISIRTSSRSSSQQMVGGKMRTVYDFSSQHNANDFSGKMVHNRQTDFKSDFAHTSYVDKDGNRMFVVQQ